MLSSDTLCVIQNCFKKCSKAHWLADSDTIWIVNFLFSFKLSVKFYFWKQEHFDDLVSMPLKKCGYCERDEYCDAGSKTYNSAKKCIFRFIHAWISNNRSFRSFFLSNMRCIHKLCQLRFVVRNTQTWISCTLWSIKFSKDVYFVFP